MEIITEMLIRHTCSIVMREYNKKGLYKEVNVGRMIICQEKTQPASSAGREICPD